MSSQRSVPGQPSLAGFCFEQLAGSAAHRASPPHRTFAIDSSRIDAGSEAVVLIADDDPAMRMLAGEALEIAGFHVVEATCGKAALESFDEHRPDAVLLDVVMPEGDGYSSCEAIRSRPYGTDVPVLMMTGLDDVESIDRAYDAGATDFICKPFNYSLLAHRLRYLLRASRAFRTARESAERLSRAQCLARLVQWEYLFAEATFRWSSEVKTVFGLPEADPGEGYQALTRWVHPEDRNRVQQALAERAPHQLEYRIVLPDGSERIIHQEAEFLSGSHRSERLMGAAQDITERRQAERRATHLAHYDSLTGLPNRVYLNQYLESCLGHATHHGNAVAVLALDLDLFKRVNDLLGHAAGDALLIEVARRLEHCGNRVDPSLPVRSAQGVEYLAARLGGDEFVVVLSRIRTPEDAAVVAQRMLDRLSARYELHGTEVFLSTSIGIATLPENGRSADELLKCADAAMYHAKDKGRSNFQFFTESIHRRARRRVDLENGLRSALAALEAASHAGESRVSELELYFQPKVAVPSRRLTGAEALLRWNSAQFGAVSPAEFIPVAEDVGLILPLGEWVLRTACETGRRWLDRGDPELYIAVNISAHQFREPSFVEMVERIVRDTGFPARLLELEITEGVVMQDTLATERVIAALKELGIRIALDDFGTGYSSLSYLTRFPIDRLKIDRSFVRELGAPKNESIVSAILALAGSLAIDVVAEGVEDESQLLFLEKQGAMEIQGFYFARAKNEAEFSTWRSEYEAKEAVRRAG